MLSLVGDIFLFFIWFYYKVNHFLTFYFLFWFVFLIVFLYLDSRLWHFWMCYNSFYVVFFTHYGCMEIIYYLIFFYNECGLTHCFFLFSCYHVCSYLLVPCFLIEGYFVSVSLSLEFSVFGFELRSFIKILVFGCFCFALFDIFTGYCHFCFAFWDI